VNETVCDCLVTVKDCCTCDAGAYVPFPAWFASIVHDPAAVKLTVDPDREQTEVAEGSTMIVAGRAEDAVAVTV
jgi:hypothetical protein